MTLMRVSVVIDISLWDENDIEKQVNAITQGLVNARGWPDKYPNIIMEYEGEPKKICPIASKCPRDCTCRFPHTICSHFHPDQEELWKCPQCVICNE